MEFEIEDDPQNLPDLPEGDRSGGLIEDLTSLRYKVRERETDSRTMEETG